MDGTVAQMLLTNGSLSIACLELGMVLNCAKVFCFKSINLLYCKLFYNDALILITKALFE